MQPLLAAPRESSTDLLVQELLQNSPAIQIAYGATWLDNVLEPIGDITEFMETDSSVSSDITATIHRSCILYFSSDCPMNYVTDYVQPYMVISNLATGDSAQFNLGVYTLTSPEYDNSALPAVLELPGYDLMYLLNQPVSDSVQVVAGTDPVAAAKDVILTVFPSATINMTPNALTTAIDMTWPFGQADPYGTGSGTTTSLTIVNELLEVAGYLPVWVDWNGAFQLQPYFSPLNVASEYTFDVTAAQNIVSEARSSKQDLFDVPNTWIFVMSNITTPPVEGATQYTYIDNEPGNPGSVLNRGRSVNAIYNISAVNYSALTVTGFAQVVNDLLPAEVFTFNTTPFPIAWHRDRITYIDNNIAAIPPALSNQRQLMSITWKLTLDGSADMSWTCQTCTL